MCYIFKKIQAKYQPNSLKFRCLWEGEAYTLYSVVVNSGDSNVSRQSDANQLRLLIELSVQPDLKTAEALFWPVWNCLVSVSFQLCDSVTVQLVQWRRNEFESGWGADPAWSAGNFLGRAPPLFGSKSTISRFGERFRGGHYSLVSFLFNCCSSTHGAPVPSHL